MDIKCILKELDNLKYTQIEVKLRCWIEEAESEQDWQSMLTLLNELIGFYRDSCLFEKSTQVKQEILKLLDMKELQGTIGYATSLQNIANAERASGDFKESLLHYNEAKKIYEQLLAPNDYLFASLNNNMSLLYQETGDFELSCQCLQKALDITSHTDGMEIETAITHTNLAQSLLRLKNLPEASKHINEALEGFATDGNRDYHYSGALSVSAAILYTQGRYEESVAEYDLAISEFEKHMGKTGNYEVLRESRERAKEKAQELNNILKSTHEKQEQEDSYETKQATHNGLILCENYFYEVGLPMLQKKFPEYLSKMAVGLVGEGSECFGFDDIYSSDHDYGPGFCIWIPQKLFNQIGAKLQQAYNELPVNYNGFIREKTPEGSNRIGVNSIEAFYSSFIQSESVKGQIAVDWKNCTEENLATITNGKVFMDTLGVFTGIRTALLQYYPNTVYHQRLGEELITMSKAGQYNFGRMMKRDDEVTAGIYLSEFMKHTLRVVYLLNRKYAPYTKWLQKGASTLPILPEITDILRAITDMKLDDENIPLTIEIIAQLIVEQMIEQKLIMRKNETDPYYLETYGRKLLQ